MGKYFKKEKVISAASHRNGVGGNSFDVAIVDDGDSKKVVILFKEIGNCAVLDIEMLAAENVEFSVNSWRGDDYEKAFRKMIEARIEADYQVLQMKLKEEREKERERLAQ